MTAAAVRHARWRIWPVRVAVGHRRLFFALATALIVGLFLPSDWKLVTRLLIAWNGGIAFYFVAIGILIARSTDRSIRRAAKTTDEGKLTILVLVIVAGLAAIGAIAADLGTVKDMQGAVKSLHIALAAATIISAWFFTHLSFGLHYAHEYFDLRASEPGKPETERGGLVFPGDDEPDYWDFLYFSYVIGVASQTADIGISAKSMRRIALVHCVVAFFFNSAILALTINIAAGLI